MRWLLDRRRFGRIQKGRHLMMYQLFNSKMFNKQGGIDMVMKLMVWVWQGFARGAGCNVRRPAWVRDAIRGDRPGALGRSVLR